MTVKPIFLQSMGKRLMFYLKKITLIHLFWKLGHFKKKLFSNFFQNMPSWALIFTMWAASYNFGIFFISKEIHSFLWKNKNKNSNILITFSRNIFIFTDFRSNLGQKVVYFIPLWLQYWFLTTYCIFKVVS